MKLLLDENLSHRMVPAIQTAFPDSTHVRLVNLEHADDLAVWDYAARHGFAIVSKDSDFHQRSFLHGHPPKVVWLRVGNCHMRQILAILLAHTDLLRRFNSDDEASFLIIP